jgi:hypothetical protein
VADRRSRLRVAAYALLVRAPLPAGPVAALLLAVSVTGCGGGSSPADHHPVPRLAATITQTREDQVAARVEVAVTNRTRQVVTVDTMELLVPGLRGGGVLPKGEPLPAGQRVNLPTPYGEVSCTADGKARVGRPHVVLRVHTDRDPTSRRVVLAAEDTDGLLARIAADVCTTRRLDSEVALSFSPRWRRSGRGADTVLHGTLQARLTGDQPLDVTQLAGTVIYDLSPDRSAAAGPGSAPLAHLTPARPRASVPVVMRQARCDGHARGEVKKPYQFFVWVGPPGTAGYAIGPAVSDADRAALRAVCPL